MNNLSILFQKIKQNPVTYLDKPSITSLHFFLSGYTSTRIRLGLDREGSGIEGFQEWVQERAKTDVSQSWAGITLFRCGSERSAFDEFFRLFEMFLNQNESSNHKSATGEDFSSMLDEPSFKNHDYYDELLGMIKKRPGMYLGTSSITRLDMLLRGCSLARREVDVEPTKAEGEFEGFQSWIQEKYGIKSNQSWAKIILFYSMDETEALERFFELYEEYFNRNKSSEINESIG